MSAARDLIALAKPRITMPVVLTAASGMYLAPGELSWARTLLVITGTVLLVAGANAMNMYLERDIDGRAARTRSRPLPAGRLPAIAALALGLGLGVLALPLLYFCGNPLTALLGLIAYVTYVAVYTPMKQSSPGALVVGSVPGAMPPLMGWTAVTGHMDPPALVLFAIMFLWQLPHFLAISLYRDVEYERAGYKVTATEHGTTTAKVQILMYLLALGPVTLVLVPLGVGGPLYLCTAVVAGAMFLGTGILGLRRDAGRKWARNLFTVSLLYLVMLLGGLVLGQAVHGEPQPLGAGTAAHAR